MKLKSEDLMIGDWLQHNISGTIHYLKIDFGCEIEEIEESGYEPVPLTAEILEKNGFEYHPSEIGMFYIKTAPYYQIDNSPKIWCDGNPFSVWFEDSVDIKYVHELQHVLKLCQIKKEIIL